jgi:hypothetical protein
VFHSKMLSPLAGESASFNKNSQHFVQLLKNVNIHSVDIVVSLMLVVSLVMYQLINPCGS